MEKRLIMPGCGLAIAIMVIVALFTDEKGRGTAGDALHEIRTFDAWNQSAFTPLAGVVNADSYPWGRGPVFPIAFSRAPAIREGQAPPELIEELGIEVIPISGGKVKITGVMGNSWGARAGLKRNDIILRFNKKSINSLQHLESLVNQAAPEKDYRIKILRGGRMKSLLVTVGEGEMEGFTPIAFMQPTGQTSQWSPSFQCPSCGSRIMTGR